MKLLTHLFLNECELLPGTEWKDPSTGWKIVLISKGFFYWIARPGARDLQTGDVLVIGPGSEGVLRTSQISAAALHFFYFDPEHLVGLMSLSERLSLESFAQTAQTRIIPAADPIAREYTDLVSNAGKRRGFFYRCRILHLVAMIFGDALPTVPQPKNNVATTLLRFEEIIARIPDADLINYTSEKLAEMCGCSLRHFRRMFRKQFKTSIRAKQTELRLEKARQLLADTEDKIITIAYESGYRHLGFFNAMFKKRFGMTPSEWRRTNPDKEKDTARRRPARGKSAVLALLLMVAMMFGWPAESATPTTNAPPGTIARATNAPGFHVIGYEVQGNTLLSQELLEKIFTDYAGPAISVDQIRAALGELQLAYRGRGYVTVAVSLPVQSITNGYVKVMVTEAKLAEIAVEGNRFYSEENVRAALPSLRTNVLLNNLVFQQELDAANQSRDRQIYPVIGPGPEPGTSSLTLKVKDQFPMHGRFELNNVSTPGTPELRMNSSLQYNNLWQLDHQAGVQYTFTPQQYKAAQPWPDVWNRPLVANYSTFYRVPLDAGDSASRRARDYAVADFGYDETTRKFRAPALTGRPEIIVYGSRSDSDTGLKLGPRELITQTAIAKFESQSSGQDLTLNENVGARLTVPLPSRAGINWSVNGGLDYKNYELQSFNTNTFFTAITITNNGQPQVIRSTATFGQPPVSKELYYFPLAFGFDASRSDKWGVTVFNWNNSFNFTESEQDGFKKVGGPEASPNYYIASAGLTRDFNLPGEFQLHLRADGQWASGPLINSEQFGVGGLQGVRGYQDGQIYGDSGWRMLFEPRTPLINCGLVDGTETMYARLSVFMDYGQVFYAADRAGAPEHYNLWGTGVGLNVTIGSHFDLRFSWGIALQDVPGWSANKSRASFGLGYQF